MHHNYLIMKVRHHNYLVNDHQTQHQTENQTHTTRDNTRHTPDTQHQTPPDMYMLKTKLDTEHQNCNRFTTCV